MVISKIQAGQEKGDMDSSRLMLSKSSLNTIVLVPLFWRYVLSRHAWMYCMDIVVFMYSISIPEGTV